MVAGMATMILYRSPELELANGVFSSFFHRNFTYQTNTEYTAAAAAIKVILQNWLVVQPPLWKIWKSIGMISNPILMGK